MFPTDFESDDDCWDNDEELDIIEDDSDYKTRFSDFEFLILNNIIFDGKYRTKALSQLSPDYFDNPEYIKFFGSFKTFSDSYNSVPTYKEMGAMLAQKYEGSQLESLRKISKKVYAKQHMSDTTWLVDQSDIWIRERAMRKAILECNDVYNRALDTSDGMPYSEFSRIIEEAQGASLKGYSESDIFDEDYLDEFVEFMYSDRRRIPFSLDIMNKVTNGGITRKSLSIACAPTNGGKSLHLASHMADYIRQGYNCLYVTFELSKHETTARFVGNFLETDAIDLETKGKGSVEAKAHAKKFIKSNMTRFKNLGNKGSSHVEEYIAGVHTVMDIEQKIKDIKLNKGVDIDVVFVDYIKNMRPINVAKNASEYTKLGANSLALKGMANKLDVCVWTAMQLSRASESKEYLTKEDIAESLAIAFDADFMYAFKYDKELSGYKAWKLKSRMSSMTEHEVFCIGCTIPQFKLHDMEQRDFTSKITVEEELKDDGKFNGNTGGFNGGSGFSGGAGFGF